MIQRIEEKFHFKNKFSFEERKFEAEITLKSSPNFIPIIIEKSHKSNLPNLEKIKYLVSDELKLFSFVLNIRKKLKLNESESLFIFVGENKIEKLGSNIKDIYNDYKDIDGFLYMEYSNYETFGTC